MLALIRVAKRPAHEFGRDEVRRAGPVSEIIFASSDPAESRRISRQVEEGKLRSLLPRVYTSNLTDEPAKIVRRNLALMLGALYPDVVLSHRSALEGGTLNGPEVYLTYRMGGGVEFFPLTRSKKGEVLNFFH